MKNLRSLLLFFGTIPGIAISIISYMVMVNAVPSIGLPIKGFVDSLTLFIWRSNENINFYENFAFALAFFYPAFPAIIIRLAEFFHEVYLYRMKKVKVSDW